MILFKSIGVRVDVALLIQSSKRQGVTFLMFCGASHLLISAVGISFACFNHKEIAIH